MVSANTYEILFFSMLGYIFQIMTKNNEEKNEAENKISYRIKMFGNVFLWLLMTLLIAL